jgi:uncharacterized protein YhhL (DUF1145 family)
MGARNMLLIFWVVVVFSKINGYAVDNKLQIHLVVCHVNILINHAHSSKILVMVHRLGNRLKIKM